MISATSIQKQLRIAEKKAESQVLRIIGCMEELTLTAQGAQEAVD